MGTTGLAGSPKSAGLTDQSFLIFCVARIFLNMRHICIRIYMEGRAEIKQFETFMYILRDNSRCG